MVSGVPPVADQMSSSGRWSLAPGHWLSIAQSAWRGEHQDQYRILFFNPMRHAPCPMPVVVDT
jgi:hypothetical protein